MHNSSARQLINNQDGAVAALVAVCLIIFVAFTALAIDIGHLYVVRNELQNAADAGALAGARMLLNEDGSIRTVPTNAITAARGALTANKSEKLDVEEELIERGHWSFTNKAFTPNSSPQADITNLIGAGFAVADDPKSGLINAVHVVTKRETNKAASYFAFIFGNTDGFTLKTEAVAYIGFEGTMPPKGFDQPIAICYESIKEDWCNIGRMINSGNDPSTSNTAAWTNFMQPCDNSGGNTANGPTVNPLICANGNPNAVTFMIGMGTTNGMDNNVMANMKTCWWNKSAHGTKAWPITLPIVSCPDNSISNCAIVLGAVRVNVLWINDNNDRLEDSGVPNSFYPTTIAGISGYGAWTSPDSARAIPSWDSFTSHFHLRNQTGASAEYGNKAIYFLPECEILDRAGTTGGVFSNVLAKYPVLVN